MLKYSNRTVTFGVRMIKCLDNREPTALINYKFQDDRHVILLESRLHKWFGCQVTAVPKVDSKNMCAKGMISRKKVPAAAKIPTNKFCLLVKCSYTACCGFQRNIAQVFSTPSPLTHFRKQMKVRVSLQ